MYDIKERFSDSHNRLVLELKKFSLSVFFYIGHSLFFPLKNESIFLHFFKFLETFLSDISIIFPLQLLSVFNVLSNKYFYNTVHIAFVRKMYFYKSFNSFKYIEVILKSFKADKFYI